MVEVAFTREAYETLLLRYREVPRPDPGEPGGEGEEEAPYDIRPDLIAVDAGLIDAAYMQTKFEQFMKELAHEHKRDFAELAETADVARAKAHFDGQEGKDLSPFEVTIALDGVLRRFILAR